MVSRSSAIAPLKYPDFRNLWSATLVSHFGGMVQAVSAAWLMTSLTDDATLIALVQASNTLPVMIFALAAGALADNFNRRHLMMAAQGFMAIVSVVLAVMAWGGLLTPWLLLGFTFMIGMGAALYNPPFQASMGDLVPRDDLPTAVTLNSVGFNLMRSVGPAAGGIIVAGFGAAVAFAINAISYLPLMGVILRWRPQFEPRTTAPEPFLGAVGAGLRYVALSPHLMRVLLRTALFGFSAVALLALLPLVAKSHPDGGSLLFGFLLGCFGVGAIIGAMTNARIRDRLNNEHIIRLSLVINGVSLAVIGLTDHLWFQAVAIVPAGMSWVLSLSLFNVSVQLSTPRWVVARALGLYQTAAFGAMAAGSWVWGSVSSFYSIDMAFIGAAGALFVTAVIGFWVPVPDFNQSDLSPSNRFREPALGVDLRGRSGPILVMVDYHIAQKDTSEFLRLMTLRRNIRRRDGARSWTLLRDLETPDHWSESYHIATWDDYVRHNMRRTISDAEVTESLAKLHQGPESPMVHRMIERHAAERHRDVPLLGKLELP